MKDKKKARQDKPTGATENKIKRDFIPSDNPRHLRVIHELMVRSRPREEIDRIAGCSNGPDLIARLRGSGLEIPCVRVPCLDRDGLEVRRGVYYLTASDRRKVARRIRTRGR